MATKGSGNMKGGSDVKLQQGGGKKLRIKTDPDGLMHPTESQKRAVYNDRLDHFARQNLNARGYAKFSKDPEGYMAQNNKFRTGANVLRDAIFDRPWYTKGMVPDGYSPATAALVGVKRQDTQWLHSYKRNGSLFNKSDKRPRWVTEVG